MAIKQFDPLELKKHFPIDDKCSGWFFRTVERSPGMYLVEGIDLWGRTLSRSGIDPYKMLDECVADAKKMESEEGTP